MEIAIIAGDRKKELMTQFCIAYCGILSNHNLCATGTTCKYIAEATGLHIERLLSGDHGRVDRWRAEQRLLRTRERRPDLLEGSDAEISPPPEKRAGRNDKNK